MDEKGARMHDEMDVTLAALTDKLGQLDQQVSGAVKTVKQSVNTVRNSFDLGHQVRQRPWTLMVGASAIGLLMGYRSAPRKARYLGRRARSARVPATSLPTPIPPTARSGHGEEKDPTTPVAAAPGRFSRLGEKFEPEISELKGLVVGTLLGIAREMIVMQAMNVSKPSDETPPSE